MSKPKLTISPEVIAESEQIAKATQRPGQSKAQTKLIAQGIQKGIAEYKKQQKSKARELDKKLKQLKKQSKNHDQSVTLEKPSEFVKKSQTTLLSLLPWLLLLMSWVYIGIKLF